MGWWIALILYIEALAGTYMGLAVVDLFSPSASREARLLVVALWFVIVPVALVDTALAKARAAVLEAAGDDARLRALLKEGELT